MPIVKDLIEDSPGPFIPEKLKNKIQLRASFALTENEASLFTSALMLVETKLISENIDIEKIVKVTIIVTEDGHFSIYAEGNELGYKLVFIIYRVKVWRERKLPDLSIITILLEELCHHFWGIEDEIKVKYKVLEILNESGILSKEISIDDIYNMNSL